MWVLRPIRELLATYCPSLNAISVPWDYCVFLVAAMINRHHRSVDCFSPLEACMVPFGATKANRQREGFQVMTIYLDVFQQLIARVDSAHLVTRWESPPSFMIPCVFGRKGYLSQNGTLRSIS